MRRTFCFTLILMTMFLLLGGCAKHMNHVGMMNGEMTGRKMDDQQMAQGSKMDHSAHQKMMARKNYSRSIETYQIPDLLLTDNQGRNLSLVNLLQDERPVLVNFLYATCTTICPLLSMGYIDLQRELGAQADQVLLVSITIDPEHDTPDVLEKYRKKFQGQPGWVLLTGSRIDIDAAMTAFDAYFGDKMDHQPLNFIRMPAQNKWVRLNGMINGEDFIREMKMVGVWR